MFLQALNDTDKESAEQVQGYFEVLSEKFKPQHTEKTPSLIYCNW